MNHIQTYSLGIMPLGRVEESMVRAVEAGFVGEVGIDVKIFPPGKSPVYAFDRHRIQYDAATIIKKIEASDFEPCRRMLALVDVDIFLPVFTFVFGEARKGGRVAVASLSRLEDKPERVVKIALHEFGHLCMLDHCHEGGCLMAFSPGLKELDALPPYFCRYCLDQVRYMAQAPIPLTEP